MSISLLLGFTTNKPSVAVETTLARRDDILYHVSPLVKELLPEFIHSDHEKFGVFMDAYFEWLEIRGNAGERTYSLEDLSDIDTTVNDFVKHFKNQYLNSFPEKLAVDLGSGTPADKTRLLKKVKEFYRARGTEKSYQLLMRILFDVSTSFYYPRKDILEVSSGKWYEPKTLKVSYSNDTNIFDSIGTTIKQNVGGTIVGSAKVEEIITRDTNKTTLAELFLSNINGIFQEGKELTISVGGVTGDLTETVYPVLTGISAATAGRFFEIGDVIKATGLTGGAGARGIVSAVDSRGSILSIVMSDFGVSYTGTAGVVFTTETYKGEGASFESSVGSLCEYPGYYLNNDGKLNSNKKIRDNYFYQEFSYQLRTAIALNEYKQSVLDLIHPAGLKLFGALVIASSHGMTSARDTKASGNEISVLGHYTPYRFSTSENLRFNTKGLDLYPFGYNGMTFGGQVSEASAEAYAGTSAEAWITLDNAPGAGNTITITDGNGLSKTYLGGGANSATNGRFKATGTPAQALGGLKNAINHANGHNGTIVVGTVYDTPGDSITASVKLQQGFGGASGNTEIGVCGGFGFPVAKDSDGSEGVIYYENAYGPSGSAPLAFTGGGGTLSSVEPRYRLYYGNAYQNMASRTGPSGISSDLVYGISSATHGFRTIHGGAAALSAQQSPKGVIGSSGETWDPGITGPMFFGARLVEGVTGLTYGGTAEYGFATKGATVEPGDFGKTGQAPYWVIFPHPNTRGLYTVSGNAITFGASMAAIPIDPFLYIENNTEGGISLGTRVLINATVNQLTMERIGY